MERYDRNIRFFGIDGQRLLQESIVAIVGCGGLGMHVIQQLAYLGIKRLVVIDDEELSESNLNRYVLAYHDDPVPGSRKVDLVKRSVAMINPSIEVITVHGSLQSQETFDAMKEADFIFGCLDDDGPRFILNEYALAYGKKLYDLASDTENKGALLYGGRVSYIGGEDNGCLVCMDLLDMAAVSKFFANQDARQDQLGIYGVDKNDLDTVGPSVISLNGIIASHAVMEYMLQATGIRPSKCNLQYRGNMGIVAIKNAPANHDCHYCNNVKNTGEKAGVERYLEAVTS